MAHKVSMGNGSIIREGDVQRMSAGTGVRHSEFNPSASEALHLLQIWIMPKTTGMHPSYEEKHFGMADKRGKLRLIASSDGADGSVTVHQDVGLYAGLLTGGETATHTLLPGRRAYVHLARGSIQLNGTMLSAGDAAMLQHESKLVFEQGQDAEVLLFDLV